MINRKIEIIVFLYYDRHNNDFIIMVIFVLQHECWIALDDICHAGQYI